MNPHIGLVQLFSCNTNRVFNKTSGTIPNLLITQVVFANKLLQLIPLASLLSLTLFSTIPHPMAMLQVQF